MTQELANSFWDKWHNADELQQLELVQTLTGFKKDYGQASLLNSYLVDLELYLKGQILKELAVVIKATDLYEVCLVPSLVKILEEGRMPTKEELEAGWKFK